VRVIPIIEAVVRVYATHAPPPRRLKFLAKEYGEDTLRQLITAEPVFNEALPETTGLSDCLAPESMQPNRLILPVFAGRITAEQLLAITDIADIYADGVLMVTENQDIALHVAADSDYTKIVNQLHLAMGLASTTPSPALRVCPGNHECLMGLAATRDVAQDLLDHMNESGHTLTWALSGCPNSCSQPQLADVGIVAARLTADSVGGKSPRFDLYRRTGSGFGQKVQQGLTRRELLDRLGALSHD
jgi:ferredoxin-nitrite reductase